MPTVWPTGFPWGMLGAILPKGSHFPGCHIEHAVTLGTVSRALSPCAVPEGGGAVAWKTALNEVQ